LRYRSQRQVALDLFKHCAEQLSLVAEVVIKGATSTDAGSLDEIADADVEVTGVDEQRASRVDEVSPGAVAAGSTFFFPPAALRHDEQRSNIQPPTFVL
jgi:hypothetical protein